MQSTKSEKELHLSMAVRLLWKKPGLSRAEIEEKLNLPPSVAPGIIDTLVEKGVIQDGRREGTADQGAGAASLRLNKDFGCALGLEIQPAGYHCVIINMDGEILYSSTGFLPELAFNDIIDDILYGIYPEIRRIGLPLLGICLALPGIIDSEHSLIMESHPFSLKDYTIEQGFSKKYGIPFYIENDANCLAWLELAKQRRRDPRNFICVNAECNQSVHSFGEWAPMGIGLGLAIDGTVYSGSGHAAGEMITLSWRGDRVGQTGLKARKDGGDTDAFIEWTVDLFSSLTCVISALNPEAVFIHGELARRAARINAILDSQVPQFREIMKQTDCELIYSSGSDFSIAEGAANMYLLQLLAVPGYRTTDVPALTSWERVFGLAN